MVDQKRKVHRRSSSSASYGSNGTHAPEKDFQCWTSLRAIFGLMMPSCCAAGNGGAHGIGANTNKLISNMSIMGSMHAATLTSSIVTGTIFGQRKGRVNFCVQEDPAGPPLLLLEFAIPTHLLVKEMESGLLRITLECSKKTSISQDPFYLDGCTSPACSLPLFAEPVWSMYCNGRKVGFAMKKTAKSDSDPAIANLMSLMQTVTMGAGVIPNGLTGSKRTDGMAGTKEGPAAPESHDGALCNTAEAPKPGASHRTGSMDSLKSDDAIAVSDDKQEQNGSKDLANPLQDDLIGVLRAEKASKEEDELIYMRASYERVVGSCDSEAFHMISPDGSQCQELSIFLTRS